MHSGSSLYQLILLLVSFGGLSVMIAFVFLLPVVGNWLVGVFSLVMVDKLRQNRKNDSIWENQP